MKLALVDVSGDAVIYCNIKTIQVQMKGEQG
jgi:hypothetical protein